MWWIWSEYYFYLQHYYFFTCMMPWYYKILKWDGQLFNRKEKKKATTYTQFFLKNLITIIFLNIYIQLYLIIMSLCNNNTYNIYTKIYTMRYWFDVCRSFIKNFTNWFNIFTHFVLPLICALRVTVLINPLYRY